MSNKEFEALKIGDVVAQKRGKNKGRLAIVKHIWESSIKVDGYRETLIACTYLDLSLPNPDRKWSSWFFDFCDFECSHRNLKKMHA